MDNNGATGGALRHSVNERLKGAPTVTDSASALRAAAAPPADTPFYLQASARRRSGATEGTDKKQWGPKWTLAGCRLATLFYCESLHIISIRADMYSLPGRLVSIGLHLFCVSVKRSIMILCSLYKWNTKRIETPPPRNISRGFRGVRPALITPPPTSPPLQWEGP